MFKYLNLLIVILVITGCSVKIPPGTYSTAPPPSESGGFYQAGRDLTLTENGRFQYKGWSDDAPITKGHGGYVVFGNNLFLLFENAPNPETGYILEEIQCADQDSQVVNFKLNQSSEQPLIGVSIYNKNDHNEGTISQIDGIGHITIPKTKGKKVFVINYIFHDEMEIEFDGEKCFDIDISINEKNSNFQLGHAKVIKLKREGEQLFIKMPIWKDYSEIYLKE